MIFMSKTKNPFSQILLIAMFSTILFLGLSSRSHACFTHQDNNGQDMEVEEFCCDCFQSSHCARAARSAYQGVTCPTRSCNRLAHHSSQISDQAFDRDETCKGM